VQVAIQTTQNSEPQTYAQAQLALGRLQLNRGEYDTALQTLSQAEHLLADLSDDDGVATAKAEIAAYYLNRDEYQRALTLYEEVDAIRQRAHPDELSDHTLLMLGVVYRRLRDYDRAKATLERLVQWAEAKKSSGAKATGTHHLAWIYFDEGLLDEAERLGQEAKKLYATLNDPRGTSDADEQLGLIALARRNWHSAQAYLENSLTVREQLGNQHGMASSLRRLSRLHLKQGRLRTGLGYLGRCLTLYRRLGVLSYRRLVRILLELTG
jgi:eukaryotic-like serine/threonine-protein kinase